MSKNRIVKLLISLLLCLLMIDHLTWFSFSFGLRLEHMCRYMEADRMVLYQNRDELCEYQGDLAELLFSGYLLCGEARLREFPAADDNSKVRFLWQTEELVTIRFYKGSHYIGRIRLITPKKPLLDDDGSPIPGFRNLRSQPVLAESLGFWYLNPQFYEAVEVILEQQQISLQ